jgi:hypothetical protein
MPSELPKPWGAFLSDLDDALDCMVELHALGGFVVSLRYGMPRPTGDIDLVCVEPEAAKSELISAAGRDSALHRKHKVYLELVVLRVEPGDYRSRITEMWPGTFEHIRLMALDPYDLVLTKLDRNSPKDRHDFLYLAESVPLDSSVLRARYESDVAPYVFEAQDRSLRLTLDLWISSAEEGRTRPAAEEPAPGSRHS